MIGKIARIRNGWIRCPILLLVLPAHFIGRVLDALASCPSVVATASFYRNTARIYRTMLVGALVRTPRP